MSETTEGRGAAYPGPEETCPNCRRRMKQHLHLQVQEEGVFGLVPVALCPSSIFPVESTPAPTADPKAGDW